MALDTAQVVGSVSIAGNAYPVYGSRARAIEYLNAHPSGTTFTEGDFDDQGRAMITARRWLDRQSWLGDKTVSSQETAFPRDPDTTVPLAIEFASYELSLLILDDPEIMNQESQGSNDKVLKAGPVSIEFFSRTDGGGGSFSGKGVFPPQVADLIGPYLSSPVAVLAPYVGGTDRESSVLASTQYTLVDPF